MIFFSYAHGDRGYVTPIYKLLTNRGANVFMDCETLKGGENWQDSILQHLRACETMLCFLSEDARNSFNVQQELGIAFGLGKRIIPIVWEKSPKELPGWLNQYNAVRILSNERHDSSKAFQSLVATLGLTSTKPRRAVTDIRHTRLEIQPGTEHSPDTVSIKQGNSHILCTSTVEPRVPRWLSEAGLENESGWLTAEYSMLPTATPERRTRDVTKGKIDGLTMEIQRLIGRTMRSSVNLSDLKGVTVWCDCDVVRADGSLTSAAINGCFVSVARAIQHARSRRLLSANPLRWPIAAATVSLIDSECFLDPDFETELLSDADLTLVMNNQNEISEILVRAEQHSISDSEFRRMTDLARKGVSEFLAIQAETMDQYQD